MKRRQIRKYQPNYAQLLFFNKVCGLYDPERINLYKLRDEFEQKVSRGRCLDGMPPEDLSLEGVYVM